ncbi:MAG: hypothetical protein U0903_16675 [Planctomycetales bacterium]
MDPILAEMNKTFFLVPLAVTISLVYAATRYEAPASIFRRALRVLVLILGGMGAVIGLLMLLSVNQ